MFRCMLAAILGLLPTVGFAAPKEESAQIGIHLRYVTVPEAEMEKLGLGLAPLKAGTVIAPKVMNELLVKIKTEKNVGILTMPRIVAPVQQSIVIDNTIKEFFLVGLKVQSVNGIATFVPQNEPFKLGEEATIQGALSADRKFIQLDLKFSSTSVESIKLLPITMPISPIFDDGHKGEDIHFTQYIQQPKFWNLKFEKKLSMPVSGSALIVAGNRTREVREEFDTPVLSKIPYVNRLFNVGYTQVNEMTLVQVTADLVESAEAKPER